MTLFERIKELSKKRGVSLSDVSQALGKSQNYIYTLKTQLPNTETAEKLADYFHVSVDYLLGRVDEKDAQDQKDLKKFLDDNLNYGMTYDGQDLSKEDKEKLKVALTQIFWEFHDDFKKNKKD